MSETENTTLARVHGLIAPIIADLHLDLYDLEFRGGTLRITIDKPVTTVPSDSGTSDSGASERARSELAPVDEEAEDSVATERHGLDMEMIALATRLISRELDHEDPVPGHYTLEVSSPGLERTLRTADHFVRSIGAIVAVRLRDIGEGGERRVHGVLEAADDTTITVRTEDGDVRTISHTHIDRAKTVFVWGPTPKPGTKKPGAPGKKERQP